MIKKRGEKAGVSYIIRKKGGGNNIITVSTRTKGKPPTVSDRAATLSGRRLEKLTN